MIYFMNGICTEFDKGLDFDKLDHLVTEAYNLTLKKYHMWLVQNVFKVSFYEIFLNMRLYGKHLR